MLKTSSVRVPPPGLTGKLRSSESDSVNAGAGLPTKVFTSTATLGPPTGPGKLAPLMVNRHTGRRHHRLGLQRRHDGWYEDGERHSDADEETQDQRPVRAFSRTAPGAHVGGWMVNGASKPV
jgi:hypothetical protein